MGDGEKTSDEVSCVEAVHIPAVCFDCQACIQAGKQHGAGVRSSGQEEAALAVELFSFWLDALRFDF